jgi:exonuclease SbcD
MSIRILATADIHMGKRSTYVEADKKEAATIYTWKAIVKEAIDSKVDFLVLVGDTVDRENRYFEALGPLHEGFRTLADKGITVLLTAGNHDFDVLPQLLRLNDHPNVRMLGAEEKWEAWETEVGGKRVRFLGWSFRRLHCETDPMKDYPGFPVDHDAVTVGLLHGDLGNPLSRYAPIDPVGLVREEVDVWVLGHIHKPIQHRETSPMVFYPGSPHAMSPKEDGGHGAVLLELEGRGFVTSRRLILSPIRYEKLFLDMSESKSADDARYGLMESLIQRSHECANEHHELHRVVYDLTLTVPRIQRESWEKSKLEILGFENGIPGGLTYAVRDLEIILQTSTVELHEISKEPTDAGELAKAILAMDKGEENTLVDTLYEGWRREYRNFKSQTIYQPLFSGLESPTLDEEKTMKAEIRRQGMRLIDTLLKQRNP